MVLFLGLASITIVAAAVSWRRDPARTRQALRQGVGAMARLAPMLLGVISLVGLTLALVPPELMAGLLNGHGLAGFFLIAGVGSVAAIPAPLAFPLAGSLLDLGAGTASVATFITTLTMVSVVSIPLEVAHFGRRFALARQGLSFIMAVGIGALMGGLL